MFKYFVRCFAYAFLVGVGCLAVPRAGAQVILHLTAAGGGQTVNLVPGGTFSFTASIEVQGIEQIDSFGYYLNSTDGLSVNVSNYFSILDRVTNTGLFPAGDLIWTDAEVATSPDSILAPSNGLNLGAALTAAFSGPNTFLLGTYTLQVAPLVPANTYLVTPASAVWSFQGTEFSFNSVDSITVNVIPEPSSGLLLLAGLGFLVRRKTKRLAV